MAPQQLNTHVGILVVHQILADGHTDNACLGIIVTPNPGIVGLVPPQGVLDIDLAIGAEDEFHLVGKQI